MTDRPDRTETDAGSLRSGPPPEDLGSFPTSLDELKHPDRLPVIDPQNYVVEGEIARGGMGRILRAVDLRLDREVAIKQLLVQSDRLMALFEREIRITAKLQHPAIVNVYEAGQLPTGELFYAMKLVAGRSLATAIDTAETFQQRLGMLPSVVAVCDALAYSHRNRIIHRDLKPSNVLVGDFGETVVIDWGIAKNLDDDGADPDGDDPLDHQPHGTVSGQIVGTPNYMAPEQANREMVDERTDVYALGGMLYHLLAGKPPFRGETAEQILTQVRAGAPPPLDALQPHIPGDLLTIVERAMSRYPGDRYDSAVELAADLKRFHTGQLVAAHDYSRRELFARWGRRNRAAVSVAGLAVVMLAVVSVLGVRRIIRERDLAASRANRVTLAQARVVLDRDPAEAVAVLQTLSADSRHWGVARILAADARERGIGVSLVRHPHPVTHIAGGTPLLVSASTDGLVVMHEPGRDARTLWRHEGEVTRLVVHPSGRWVASAGRDRLIRLLDVRSGAVRVIREHNVPVLHLAFAHDAPLLVSADEAAVLRVWDLTAGTGRIVSGPPAPFTHLAVSRTGRYIAAIDRSEKVRVWDLSSTSTGPLQRFDAAASQLAFSPRADVLAVATTTGEVQTVALPTFAVTTRGTVSRGVERLVFGPNGRRLVVTTRRDGPVLIDLDGGARHALAHPGIVLGVVFSPDGRLVASAGKDRTVRVFDVDGAPLRIFRGHRAAVTSLQFGHAGRSLVSGSTDRSVRAWTLADSLPRRLRGHRSWIARLAFAPNQRTVVSASWDFDVAAWDLKTDKMRWLRGHSGPVRDLAVSADGRVAATVSMDRSVRLWDLRGDAHRRLGAHQAAALSVALSADGTMVASGGADNAVRLWQTKVDGGRTLVGHRAAVNAVAISPDGRWVGSASADRTARLWAIDSGDSQLVEHQGAVTSVVFSPDGRWLATAGHGQVVRLLRIGHTDRRILRGHSGAVRHLAFSPDSRRLASASDDLTVRVWDVETSVPLVLSGHQDFVKRVSFHPRGEALASVSEDGTVRIWELKTGQSRVLRAQRWLADVAWSSDGQWLAAGGADGNVRLWRDDLPHDSRELRLWLSRAAAPPEPTTQAKETPRGGR